MRDRIYVTPTARPKLKCQKRSSNGILARARRPPALRGAAAARVEAHLPPQVSYTYVESSKWGRDTVEIEAKEDYDETDEWQKLDIDTFAQTAALRNITPGVSAPAASPSGPLRRRPNACPSLVGRSSSGPG